MTDAPITRKRRDLTTTEAELLTAWKTLLDQNEWSEFLNCGDCFSNHAESHRCACETIPGKHIRIHCACTTREWVGIK